MGRTQRGNNNAYCHDDEISWLDWSIAPERSRLLEFVRRLIGLRRRHPVFRRRHFFQGRPIRGSGVKDIMWLKPDGGEMTDAEWQHEFPRCLGVMLAGEGMTEIDQRGRPVTDRNFLMLFNAHHEEIVFTLPNHTEGLRWLAILDTAHGHGLAGGGVHDGGSHYTLKGRSLALLQEQKSGA